MAKKKDDPLKNWTTLNEQINRLSEKEVKMLLDRERKKGSKRRLQFVIRLYGRYNILRTQRERESLLSS